jgi:hypothetical protein
VLCAICGHNPHSTYTCNETLTDSAGNAMTDNDGNPLRCQCSMSSDLPAEQVRALRDMK